MVPPNVGSDWPGAAIHECAWRFKAVLKRKPLRRERWDGRVLEEEILTSTEIEPHIGPDLRKYDIRESFPVEAHEDDGIATPRRKIGHHIRSAVPRDDHKGVRARTARQGIVASPSPEQIIGGVAREHIVPVTAQNVFYSCRILNRQRGAPK